MIALLLMHAVAGTGPHLDRIEVVSDDPGTFVYDELPMLRARPGATGLRALAQVQPVIGVGRFVTVGVSLTALTPAVELSDDQTGFGAVLAMPTRLGLPTGAIIAGSWRQGPLWLDVGLRAHTGASWLVPAGGDLRVGPTIGLGWVPAGQRPSSTSGPTNPP